MTTYTITANEAFNSLEITFTEKPGESIREALKSLKFRWHAVKKIWYGYADRETVEKALNGEQITAEPTATKTAKPAKFNKEEITAEYSKAWTSDHMIKYCVGQLAGVAILPNGDIISIEKQRIETRFCFGESGYDYEDAQEMAQHARTSEDYFRAENMKSFNAWVKDLEEAREMRGRYYIIIRYIHYTGQTADCKLRGLDWVRDVDLLDALGGSAYLEELPGKHIEKFGGRVATPEEINIILTAYKAAREDHRKKVESYLKRYGLSKVESWTYWREA